MPSHQAIIDWVTATGLRPWLQDLTKQQQLFLKRYHQMLEEQYPLQENGRILLAFPRLLLLPGVSSKYTSAGNNNREEFLLELAHRSSVTSQFNSVADRMQR